MHSTAKFVGVLILAATVGSTANADEPTPASVEGAWEYQLYIRGKWQTYGGVRVSHKAGTFQMVVGGPDATGKNPGGKVETDSTGFSNVRFAGNKWTFDNRPRGYGVQHFNLTRTGPGRYEGKSSSRDTRLLHYPVRMMKIAAKPASPLKAGPWILFHAVDGDKNNWRGSRLTITKQVYKPGNFPFWEIEGVFEWISNGTASAKEQVQGIYRPRLRSLSLEGRRGGYRVSLSKDGECLWNGFWESSGSSPLVGNWSARRRDRWYDDMVLTVGTEGSKVNILGAPYLRLTVTATLRWKTGGRQAVPAEKVEFFVGGKEELKSKVTTTTEKGVAVFERDYLFPNAPREIWAKIEVNSATRYHKAIFKR